MKSFASNQMYEEKRLLIIKVNLILQSNLGSNSFSGLQKKEALIWVWKKGAKKFKKVRFIKSNYYSLKKIKGAKKRKQGNKIKIEYKEEHGQIYVMVRGVHGHP